MNIAISQSALVRELGLLSVVIDRKVTIPILAGVKMTADESGELHCVATNVDNALTVRFQADAVARHGSSILPLDTLLGLAQRFPAGSCTLDATKAAGTLSANGSSARLPLFDAADYPTIPAPSERAASVSSSVLLDLIARVRYAMGESTYYPAGAHCAVTVDAVALAATDSYQIAIAKGAADSVREPLAFSIGDRAWDALVKVLKHEDDDTLVAIAAAEGKVWFSTPTRTLGCRQFDKVFPQVERVIPTTFTWTVTVPTAPLRDALRRHLVVATVEGRRAVFTVTGGALTLKTETVSGTAEDAIALTDAPDTSAPFALNVQFLLNAVEAVNTAAMTLSWSDGIRSVVCHPADAPDRLTATIATMRT